MKITVGRKIGGGFTLILLFLAFISVNGIYAMRSTDKNLDDITLRIQRISLDYQIKNQFQGAPLAMRGYMAYGDEKYLTQYNDQINKTAELIKKRIQNSSDQARPIYEKLLGNLQDYDKQITEKMVPLLKEKKVQEATAIGVTIAPITAEINKALDERIAENENKSVTLISAVQESAARSNKTILFSSIIALLAGIILTYLTTRSITGPVGIMMSGVRRLEKGDFTQNIEVRSGDEIGELARTVNQTRQHLKDLVREIVEVSQVLAAQSQELAASSEEVSATTEEVAGTTNEVAAMADSSLENANTASREAQKVVDVARSGGEIVKNTVSKITSIAESTARVNNSIQKLGELSVQIGNITDVITGLADQTNLLALNAAIEAARAGDQGRGFAVVAEEVRKLAEQSASAAKEIGQLIKHIQSGVNESIQSMEQGSLEVNEGVQLASEAGNALSSIIEAIKRNIQLVDEITLGAKQTSEGTQQLSASNEQITSTVQQVSSATQELSDIANKLQTSVAMFKV